MISPLYGPGRSRGFSNEESIHTASIQLTLSANPLSAPILPASLLPSFLSFFLPASLSYSRRSSGPQSSPFDLSSAESNVGKISFTRPRARTCPTFPPPTPFPPPHDLHLTLLQRLFLSLSLFRNLHLLKGMI